VKKLFIHRPLFRIVMPPIYGTLVYFLILLINNSILSIYETFFSQEVYLSIVLTYIVMEVNHLGVYLSEKFFKSLSLRNKVLIQLGINSTLTLLVVFLTISSYFTYILGFSTYLTEQIYFSVIFLVTSWMYSMINFSHMYLHLQNQELLDEETQLRQSVEAEFQTYQYEMNPMLLFESLESLISLVHKNPVAAEDYIDRLSVAYRYILTNKRNEVVNVLEELKAVDNLVCLQNVRYNNKIEFVYSISGDDEQRKIVPGTFTSILEMIIRRSIINDSQPIQINCFMETDGYFTLQYKSNDRLVPGYPGKNIVEKLEKTYSFLSDMPVVQVEAFGETYIKIPVLEIIADEVLI